MTTETPAGRKPCVLVVDDEPQNLTLFRRVFAREYDIVAVEDLPSALNALRQGGVDVVVTDQTLREGSGVELIMESQRSGFVRPTLMLTGYPDSPEIMRALKAGMMFQVIVKPWERAEVHQAIEHLLHMRGISEPRRSEGQA